MHAPDNAKCPVARTASVIANKWTSLILRDLLMNAGVRRYHELLESLTGIAPNTLSERLKDLEAAGVLERRFYERHPPRAEYVLTSCGKDLGAVVRAMRDFGDKYPGFAKPDDRRHG
jgi:DNA-binding HxlR family transcriptional regulator